MASAKVVGKTIVISLAIVCVLTLVMMPVASASYGDVRRFTRPSPFGLGPAKLWDVYFAAPFDPPGRVITIFTCGIPYDENWINYLDSNEALAIGTVGIYVEPPECTDHKSARAVYDSHMYCVLIDGVQIAVEKTPMRHCLVTDHETGEKFVWWEWRYGATYKEGELAELIGLGPHTIRFQMYDALGLYFDSDWIDTFQFVLV
ncbi:MAG: hypothetical protein ACFFCJ_01150 [Promethearchaeota archaeon]